MIEEVLSATLVYHFRVTRSHSAPPTPLRKVFFLVVVALGFSPE